MRSPQKIIVVVLVLIVAAGIAGWRIGKKARPASNGSSGSASQTATTPSAAGSPNSLVSYTLPDGWKENTCSGVVDKTYITPAGTTLNCNANPSAPIKIYVDAQGTKDCQQLEHIQNVRKHICSSLYINSHKSLKTLTEYSASGSSANTTVSDYYIDTGKGVVAVEYTYTTNSDYQTGFDRLATSVKVNQSTQQLFERETSAPLAGKPAG